MSYGYLFWLLIVLPSAVIGVTVAVFVVPRVVGAVVPAVVGAVLSVFS